MHTLTRLELNQLAKLRLKSRERREQGLFMVEGATMLGEALKSGWTIEQLIVTSTASEELIDSLKPKSVVQTDADGMNRLSGLQTPLQLIGVVRIPQTRLENVLSGPVIACLDGVTDPGNLGTIIRTAEWFGVSGLVVDGLGVDPFNEKVVRASMGSIFRVKIWESADLASDLKTVRKSGYKLIVTDVRGSDGAVPKGNICLVMGSEAHGVSPKVAQLADAKYSIKGSGKAESLNVAVSFGIALYDLTK